MSTGHEIENRGIAALKLYFESKPIKIEKSKNKTYDLCLNGQHVEVKTKNKSLLKMDFLSFTKTQYKELKNGKNFKIYLVSNLEKGQPEIHEMDSKDLLEKVKPREIKSYELDKSKLIKKKVLRKLS